MAPVYKIRAADQTITDISSYFRLYKLDVATEAEEGGVAQSTVYADDPTGALDIGGHRIFTVQEDTATGSNTHIYVGYTAGRRISRGDYRTTTGRVWDIDLVDLNSVLPRRIFDGTRANRPAEKDVARIQWLLTTEEASNYVDDDLYVSTTGPVDMDAVDYRGQTVANVIDDCAQASGKNWFVWYREETGEFSLWYDFATSTSYSSPIRLTNVLSEVDEVWTFPISQDTSLSRSPDRVNSGAYLPFDGGTVYTQSLTTAAAFAYRDAVMPAENVKTQAKAQARASRYLGEMDSEENVITTTVILPKGKVNFLMQGMRVQFKASHLPGYEDYVWGRLLNRSVSQVSEQYYEVKLELSPGSVETVSESITRTTPGDVASDGWTAPSDGYIYVERIDIPVDIEFTAWGPALATTTALDNSGFPFTQRNLGATADFWSSPVWDPVDGSPTAPTLWSIGIGVWVEPFSSGVGYAAVTGGTTYYLQPRDFGYAPYEATVTWRFSTVAPWDYSG